MTQTVMFSADVNGVVSAAALSQIQADINRLFVEMTVLEYRGVKLPPELTAKAAQLLDVFDGKPNLQAISLLYTQVREMLREYHG